MSDDTAKPISSKKPKKAFSAHTYLLVFLLTLTLIFAVLARGLLERLADVRAVAAHETQQAASRELQNALTTVLRSAQEQTADLAQWGEVQQQLQNPQYYSYWREQRLLTARQYPSYVDGIELYNTKGQSLAPIISNPLPDVVSDPRQFAKRIGKTLYLVTFMPVIDPSQGSQTLGYVGTIWQLVPAMRQLNSFAALDSHSLAVQPGPDTGWPIEHMTDLLQYTTQSNPAAIKMETVARNALLEFGATLGVLLILVYLGVSRLLVQPLQQMARRVAALHNADKAGRQAPVQLINSRLLELNGLSDVLQRYHQDLAKTSHDLEQTHQELWQLAHIDALTGAHNRRAFDRDWRALLETTRNLRMSVSFLLFDCDFFKAINDTYGHTTGDRLVQTLARVLQQALRKGDKLYRLGGDEFATVLLNADRDQAQQAAERCLSKLADYPFHDIGIKDPVKISVGLSVCHDTTPDNLNLLPRQADLAMYQAKRDRHRKIVHYAASMDRQTGSLISSRAVNASVEAAHGGNVIEMHYQPIVDAISGQLAHYEALVRVRDSQGLLLPDDILPVIDQRGLQVPFDLSVVQKVCDDIRNRRLPKNVGVSINLSAHTLMQPNLLKHLAMLLPLVELHTLIIEVTETDLITQMQHVTENLSRLREHGILIALDDFGSGYSSIRYLASMPVDIVKFDIELIRDLEGDTGRSSVVKNAARMVREAGYLLIAEGIETVAQQEISTLMGATHLQGFLFGKPSRTPYPATISSAG